MILSNISKNKLNEYFLTTFGMRSYTRGWLKGDCPSCGKEDKFGINLSQNRSNCFVCGFHNRPIDLVVEAQKLENRSQAWKFLKVFDGITYLEPQIIAQEFKPISLPEEFRLLTFGESFISKCARKYWKSRGFNIFESTMKGIGYCDSGEYAYRIIIPFYEAGKLVYFTARQFYDFGVKFKNPEADEIGIGKTLLIYNVDALALYNKICLVESATNSLTWGDNSIAIGGKDLSNYQFSKIIQSSCDRVIIGLDPDAYERALEIALRFVPYKKTKVLKLPEDTDINSLGRKESKKLEKNTPYKTHQEFYKELMEVRNHKRLTFS